MWENNLIINNPFGISVFGSALIKTAPDLVSISAFVARTEQKPSAAFSRARKAAHVVTDFLRRSNVEEFGMSQMTLASEYRFVGGERKFAGYTARIGFRLILRTLERTEEVASGLVDSGADEIRSIDFQTSTLKEVRAKARRLAIGAAQEKATVYADAAAVSIGQIIHIQDVNPRILQGRGEGHVQQEPVVDNDSDKQTLDPGAIEVGAAVLVAFKLITPVG
ncbi:MAG TPA: SIMPL domain-containing protein [Terriglobales bacterium]|nr:SIMPL domain-containing protein [Terriglobales bacterium]